MKINTSYHIKITLLIAILIMTLQFIKRRIKITFYNEIRNI